MNTVFKALADPTRRRVLQLLRRRPMTAGELADHFPFSKPTMSAHFAVLKEADLVELTPKARDMALVIEASKSAERDVPEYIEADHNKMTARFVRTPKLADVPYASQMHPHLIVEFYSR